MSQVISRNQAVHATGKSLSSLDRLVRAGKLTPMDERGNPKPRGQRGSVFYRVDQLDQELGLKFVPGAESGDASPRQMPNVTTPHEAAIPVRADVSDRPEIVEILRDQLQKAEERAERERERADRIEAQAAQERAALYDQLKDATVTVRLLTDQRADQRAAQSEQTTVAVQPGPWRRVLRAVGIGAALAIFATGAIMAGQTIAPQMLQFSFLQTQDVR